MPTSKTPMHRAKSLSDAVRESPVLARLGMLATQSNLHLGTVKHLLPKGLAREVKAGALDEESWCLMVTNPASASKLRQLAPDIERHLLAAQKIDIKVRIKIFKA